MEGFFRNISLEKKNIICEINSQKDLKLIFYMLGENHKGLKNRRDIEHEPGVIPKTFDITFVSGVEEYWTISWVKRIVYFYTNLIIKPYMVTTV